MIIACLTFESVICTQWHWYFGCGIGQTLWTKNRVEKRKNRNYCVKKFWGKTTTPTTPTNINHHRRCFRNGICCVASSNEEILQSAAGIAKRPIDVSSINNEYCKCFKIQFLNFENRRLWFSLCVFFCFSFHTNKKKCSILRDLLFTLMWTRFVIDKMHSRLALKSQALDLLIFNMILYTIHLCSTCESLSPWNTISWFCQYHRYGFLCVNRSGVFFLCFVLFCFVFSCVCNLFYLQNSMTIAITLVQIFSYTERIKAINLQWVERTFSEWFN